MCDESIDVATLSLIQQYMHEKTLKGGFKHVEEMQVNCNGKREQQQKELNQVTEKQQRWQLDELEKQA